LRQRLENALGGRSALQQLANAVLDEDELMMASAHGLHNLEARFPAERETALGESDRTLLGQIRADHMANLRQHSIRLLRLAEPVRKALAQSGARAFGLPAAGGVFEAAKRMDGAVAILFGGSASNLGPEQLAAEFEAAAEQLAVATGARP
jgi:hypothetical protein